MKINPNEIKVLCDDEDCSTREGRIPQLLRLKDLLLIGEGYKCPYCRGYVFMLIKDNERKQSDEKNG